MTDQRSLSRSLGLGYAIIFVVANVVGSGVYKKIAPMADGLHSSAWILLVWIAAGLITLFGAVSDAELAGMMADTGGEYVYLKKIYKRFFSFLYGWSLFTVIQTAAISSVAYVMVQSLNSIVPLPEILPSLKEFSIGGVFYPFQDFGIKLVTISAIMLFTLLNMSGLRSGAWTGKAILMFVAVGLTVVIVAGLTTNTPRPDNYMNFSELGNGTVTVSSFYTAMLAAFWAYQGWVSVGFIGGEIRNANRNIPRGIAIGVIIVIVVYALANLAYMRIMSIDELIGVHEAVNQIAAVEAIRKLWGPGSAIFISVLIFITTMGCLNASILTGSRPYYAMAREGLFFAGIGKLNRHNVPGISLLWQGIWASVLVLSGTFDQLTDMLIFAVYIFYGAMALGVFLLRYRMPDAHRPYRAWGYPVITGIFVLFCVGLFINTIITRPREAMIGLSLIAAGIPVYFIFNRKKRK